MDEQLPETGGATLMSRGAMLNVPTLWTVFVINFLALGLIWAYVTRSYPKFAARNSGWHPRSSAPPAR